MCIISMAYLGHADVGKRKGYVVGILPDGLVLSPNLLKYIYIYIYSLLLCYQCLWKIYLWEFLRYPYLPVTHCVQQGDMGYL